VLLAQGSSMDFVIPAQPEDLLDEDKAPGLKVLAVTEFAGLSKEDVNEFAEREGLPHGHSHRRPICS